ncbi:MAG TPA: ATP synthase F0 subunit B [Ilumatobacteraceae bacterium]|nr:ATP synthase F0 subunit B [Ilumatobacteraceae bacterium]
MHSAVVHLQGSSLHVHLNPASAETTGAEAEAPVSKDPGPILPEMKELAWGGGSFLVFALLMRFVLFPKVKKGMDARYHGIRSAHESADAERSAARAEVAEYEAQLAAIKAEAARTVEAARQTLEAERQAKLAQVNAGIAERRNAALAQADAAKAAARDQIAAAVSDVAGRAGELATGKRPSATVVERVVSEVMAR